MSLTLLFEKFGVEPSGNIKDVYHATKDILSSMISLIAYHSPLEDGQPGQAQKQEEENLQEMEPKARGTFTKTDDALYVGVGQRYENGCGKVRGMSCIYGGTHDFY